MTLGIGPGDEAAVEGGGAPEFVGGTGGFTTGVVGLGGGGGVRIRGDNQAVDEVVNRVSPRF